MKYMLLIDASEAASAHMTPADYGAELENIALLTQESLSAA